MTDSKTKTDKNDVVEKSAPLSIGQQLRAAREEQGLSIEDVARHLLLSKQLINEIENDDYHKISASVYINGYLRSYAQLLKIPASSVLRVDPKAAVRAELDANRKTVAKVVEHSKSGSKIDFFSYVVIAVFVLLALFWWRTTRMRSDVTPAAINSTMTELQLPSTEPQQLTDDQRVVLPQDNNSKNTPQSNTAKVE